MGARRQRSMRREYARMNREEHARQSASSKGADEHGVTEYALDANGNFT